MERVRFNECLNKELRFFNISVGTILGAMMLGVIVWTFKNILWAVGSGAIGAIIGSFVMKEYTQGNIQRKLYWKLLNSQRLINSRLPPSYQQRLM